MKAILCIALLVASSCLALADEETTTIVLDVCGETRIENPTDEQIRSELETLSTDNVDYFAVLGSSDQHYVQILGDKDVGFILEYRDGSADAHYQATDEHLSLEQVVRAFAAYRDGTSDWREGLSFKKITF